MGKGGTRETLENRKALWGNEGDVENRKALWGEMKETLEARKATMGKGGTRETLENRKALCGNEGGTGKPEGATEPGWPTLHHYYRQV